MKINRIKKDKDFVVISTNVLKNPKLSWGAKGLHSFIMQLPDNWELNVEGLKGFSSVGRDGTASLIKELIAHGYIQRKKVKSEKNQFLGYEYDIYETAQPVTVEAVNGKAVNGKPVNGNAENGKPVTIKYEDNTGVLSNKELKNEELGGDFEKSPEPTPQKDSLKQPKHLESFLVIIEHLNKQSGRNFQITENDKKGKTDKYKLVAKLLDQKYKESDFIEVINAKVAEWGNDAKMCQYLQPATLFAQRNFERYLEALQAGVLQPKPATNTNQPQPIPNEPPIEDPKKEAWYQKTLEFMKQCNPNFYINRMQFQALYFGNIYDIPPTSIDRMVRKKVPIWSTKNNIFDLLMGELNRLLQISYNGI